VRVRTAWLAAAISRAAFSFAVLVCAALSLSAGSTTAKAAGTAPALDPAAVERFARLALDCVGREYPNKIAHVMQSDADLAPPRELTPAFCGCYDWHSSVHGHWLLVRIVRSFPDAPFAAQARAALDKSLTPEKIAREVAYLHGSGRASFERPYGLAWLLQLCAELHEWDDPVARRWAAALEPLEAEAAARFIVWLPKLRYPIRIGEHDQTAFSLGLVLDWTRTVLGARAAGTTGGAGAAGAAPAESLATLVVAKARAFHLHDCGCNLSFEPSGQDFLSPCLGEADLMRRVLAPNEFAVWLHGFLPGIAEDGSVGWLPVAEVTDRADPKLAHLDGLNLSRAWMLEGIASGLPAGDPRLAAIRAAAQAHRRTGLEAVTGEHYEGGHWLGSFAVYLVTGRGLGR
jgi:hypothetical protein